MNSIIQWNCKGLTVRHEEAQLLINKIHPSYICLHKDMLENINYNLGREDKFNATVPTRPKKQGRDNNHIQERKITQKTDY